MKKTILALLLLLTLLICGAACGKGGTKNAEESTSDPNAVLTDSNVPLDLGAQFGDFITETDVAAE